jgi:two-component system chemotaxis response regulator CheB
MRGIDLVVIGGSAGALEPLLAIVSALPATHTAPIAVVVHLTPTQPSLVPALLAGVSSRKVREPEDKEPLAPNTIFVAPPNYHMLVERNRTIALSVDAPIHFSRPSIDVLFESAAHAFGDGVIGVLLSGANHDGAAGLRRIADAGGIAVVQSISSAAYPAMPATAAERVPSALACTPRELLELLARFAHPARHGVAP